MYAVFWYGGEGWLNFEIIRHDGTGPFFDECVYIVNIALIRLAVGITSSTVRAETFEAHPGQGFSRCRGSVGSSCGSEVYVKEFTLSQRCHVNCGRQCLWRSLWYLARGSALCRVRRSEPESAKFDEFFWTSGPFEESCSHCDFAACYFQC